MSSERRRDARPLVDLEADAVAEAVAEALAVPGGLDDLAGDLVERLAPDPRPDRVQRGLLGLADDLVDLARRLARVADGEGAGAVGAVAVELRPHVEDDQLAAADLVLARLGVRQGAVGPGGDDRRERGVAAELADPRFGGAGDVALAAAAEAALQASSARPRRPSPRRRRSPPAPPCP